MWDFSPFSLYSSTQISNFIFVKVFSLWPFKVTCKSQPSLCKVQILGSSSLYEFRWSPKWRVSGFQDSRASMVLCLQTTENCHLCLYLLIPTQFCVWFSQPTWSSCAEVSLTEFSSADCEIQSLLGSLSSTEWLVSHCTLRDHAFLYNVWQKKREKKDLKPNRSSVLNGSNQEGRKHNKRVKK